MGTLKVVYPAYFDRALSRREGRRVSKEVSVENVRLDDLIRAVKKLGLSYTEERAHAYSRRWWMREGRLLVNTNTSKEKLLSMIADVLKEEMNNQGTQQK